MKPLKTICFLSIGLFLALMFSSCGDEDNPIPPESIGPYTLKIIPDTTSVTLDDEVEVDIVISDIEDVYAAELKLEFNSDTSMGEGAVDVIKVVEGTFLSESGTVTTFFIKEHPVGSGYLEINTSRAASSGVTSKEDQVLATITFKGTAAGTTAVDWATTNLFDSTQPNGELIDPDDFTAVGGHIIIE